MPTVLNANKTAKPLQSDAPKAETGGMQTELRQRQALPALSLDTAALSTLLPRSEPATRSKILLQLQQQAGNRMVQRLVNRQQLTASPHRLQRQMASVPTLDVRDLPMADEKQEQIRKSARENLPIWADTFVNLWYSANVGALGAMAEPEDPDQKTASGHLSLLTYGTSLAGNLLWAATCLVPSTRAALIAAMSFGGAIAGSGTVGILAGQPASTQPSFKIPAVSALARARDGIAGVGRDRAKDVAGSCAVDNVVDTDEQKKRLWAALFTSEYNKAEPMTAAAIPRLAAAATAFVVQWQTYKHSPSVEKEGWRRANERIKRDGFPTSVWLRILWEPAGPGGPEDQYRMALANEEIIKFANETFKPVFQF